VSHEGFLAKEARKHGIARKFFLPRRRGGTEVFWLPPRRSFFAADLPASKLALQAGARSFFQIQNTGIKNNLRILYLEDSSSHAP